ncbi:hypothetical protein Clacol_005486 [Clathrus columnatus]|uniref:Cytochrome P450 n=1 Tax=Clathrus columnatus TaxID=1419009 RepID=A0AAV5ADK2_9AGAM|nr:hypothetical protein Clacol_005486 [Clathrus columnatus]
MPPYPGGKRPLPFLGHILELPKEKSWMTFRKWHEMYGPLLTIWNGNTPTVLIGDAGSISSQGKTILFATYGERWRAYRKAIHLGTSQKAVDSYLPIFENEGKVLAADFLNNPDGWYQNIFRYTASAVVAITYGRRIVDLDKDAAYQKLAETVGFQIKMNVPGAQCKREENDCDNLGHETFPVLRHLPAWMNETKRKAIEFRTLGRGNFAALVNEVRNKLATGNIPDSSLIADSYTKKMLESRLKFAELDEIEFNQQPGSLFAAGVDTTSSTLQSFVLALVLHPEVQAKLHKEMDEIIGHDRSPTWSDEVKLPYLLAVVKETLRWRPVAILGGTPHANTEDDVFVYKGKSYFIPKGTTILASLWAINMNSETYPDPNSFNPERFYNGQEYPSPGGKGHSSFGWGRRVCPGAYFAERSLYITTARLAWGFKFEMMKDQSGKDIRPDATMETGYTSGFNCRPLPFPCKISPRSGVIKSVIEKELEEALDFLRFYEE